MELLKVTDLRTGKLKRFEGKGGEIIAQVEGKGLIITKYGQKHGFSAQGPTLMQNGLPVW